MRDDILTLLSACTCKWIVLVLAVDDESTDDR